MIQVWWRIPAGAPGDKHGGAPLAAPRGVV